MIGDRLAVTEPSHNELHAENGKLREEVDRLRDFILGPDVELSEAAYKRFCEIDSYAIRKAQAWAKAELARRYP